MSGGMRDLADGGAVLMAEIVRFRDESKNGRTFFLGSKKASKARQLHMSTRLSRWPVRGGAK
jgi:hypothetical protein